MVNPVGDSHPAQEMPPPRSTFDSPIFDFGRRRLLRREEDYSQDYV